MTSGINKIPDYGGTSLVRKTYSTFLGSSEKLVGTNMADYRM